MKHKVEYYRTKYFLGELTLKDLLRFIRLEGEFTLGVNWLPIVRSRVSKRRGHLDLFTDSLEKEPDVSISLGSKVKIEGNVVHLKIYWAGYPNGRDVKIRLDSPPELLL